MAKPGPKAPAPTKPMDDKTFHQLVGMVRIQCTAEEIASVLEMSVDTIGNRVRERGYANFSDLLKRHGGEGKASLRRMQWKSAENGNVTAQIWLGKQILGQRDKSEIMGKDGDPLMPTTIDVGKLSLAERKQLLALHTKATDADAS